MGGDKFLPSDVAGDSPHVNGGYKDSRSDTVPSARDSAFGGPPRYDWIDVESSAAIKIQSNYRRHSTITQLERQGDLTSSMRNSIRARQSLKTNMVSEDVPSVFRLCGIGFLFGDALGGDSKVLNEKGDKEKEEERRRLRTETEERLRTFRMRKKPELKTDEAVEVVDEVQVKRE